MIGFIKRKVISWVREDWEKARFKSALGRDEVVSVDHDGIMDEPIRIELQGVIGGHLMRVRQPYDRKTDRTASSTYIINSGEDIGARVAKIINLELLK
jgi:hypothetical protein